MKDTDTTLIQDAQELAELGRINAQFDKDRAEYVRRVNQFFDERFAAARQEEQENE